MARIVVARLAFHLKKDSLKMARGAAAPVPVEAA